MTPPNQEESRQDETPPKKEITAEVERQMREMVRGAVNLYSEAELERKLTRSIAQNRPLRVKLGVDPTAADLHFGFTVPLNKLRCFQDLGHQAVLIIGDGTAMVGDPTGRNKARPRLTAEDVDANAVSYLEQASKVLDADRLEVRRNRDWLGKFDFMGLISLAARTTVAHMLARDDFRKRYEGQEPIYLHEFLYPLLQGFDSVEVRADVELGGQDQIFNLLVGRDLQVQEGQEPQVCLTTPLLLGTDGQKKMSKSFGNYIGISEPPADMFAKVMRINDEMIGDWFSLLTRLSSAEIEELSLEGRNPKDQKVDLGRALVAIYHGEASAKEAAEGWERVVSKGAIPIDIPVLSVGSLPRTGTRVLVIDAIVTLGFAKSRGEARRLIKQGGVSVGETRVEDPEGALAYESGQILRVGRARWARLEH